jgi:hypothetical protein
VEEKISMKIVMNAAAPGGAPPRRIKNSSHQGEEQVSE